MKSDRARSFHPTAAILAALLLAAPGIALAAGGSSAPTPTPSVPEQQKSPAELADEHYNRGLELRDKAWKLEEKVASGDSDPAKLDKKIEKAYRNASEQQAKAVELNPRHHRAYSSLGYALRKLGDYDASLAAYDRALALSPHYAEAIEYRAEAYLGLGRLDEAKEAYMHLFNRDRERADQLMEAMKKWVSENGDSPGAGEFAEWLTQRAQLADQNASLSAQQERAW